MNSQKAPLPDSLGHFGPYGGRFVPETLMAALEELEAEYAASKKSEDFQNRLTDYNTNYAGRPTPLYFARNLTTPVRRRSHLPQARGPYPHRGPQDQQRSGTGAAGAAHGQAAHHRRDRRRAARCGNGHGLRHAGAGVRGVHGRGGHAAAGHQRVSHASPWSGGEASDGGKPHPEGRHQRGHPGLGHQRGDNPLPAGERRGASPVPDDGAGFPVGHRHGGAGADAGGRGSTAGLRRGVRRRREQLDGVVLPISRRHRGQAGGRRGRRHGCRFRKPRGHSGRRKARVCFTAPCPTCSRTSTDR